jgi:multiple sugar transport system permease protein
MVKVNRIMKNHRSGKFVFTPYVLIFPTIFILAAVILFPSLQALVLSFTNYSAGRPIFFIGITNYLKIFRDTQFLKVLLNNLIYLVGSLSLELMIGMAGALLLNRKFKFQAFWICLLLSPSAMSGVVSVTIWKYLLDPTYGMVNYVISSLGFKPVIWFSTPLTSFLPIIIVSVWGAFPFVVVNMYAALSSIPHEITEAAKIDGVTKFAYFKSITLPLIMPALLLVIIFRMIGLVRAFETVWIFTGGGPGRTTEILAINLYKEAFVYLNFGKASATAWVLLIITFVVAIYVIKKTYRDVK